MGLSTRDHAHGLGLLVERHKVLHSAQLALLRIPAGQGEAAGVPGSLHRHACVLHAKHMSMRACTVLHTAAGPMVGPAQSLQISAPQPKLAPANSCAGNGDAPLQARPSALTGMPTRTQL